MRILILGGDGFCGWPCALHLAGLDHDVAIIDDFTRRRTDADRGTTSLTPIAPMADRLAAWRQSGGRPIGFARIDVARDFAALHAHLEHSRPDAVIHFAEQRSAPHSMASIGHRRATVDGNIAATHNVLAALVATGLDAHLVHLGSIGVYGYSGTRSAIPEGYLAMPREDGGAPRDILYPSDAGSIYHMTKAMDQLLFAFYNKNDGLRITDLHQGIVWGSQTEATRLHPALVNRFDYDGGYGTVLNRFLVQAALGGPLTVHGSGGQARGFIHIADTVRSIALALGSPPAGGERVRIINQVGEVLRIGDLAAQVARLTGAAIVHVDNPRAEDEANTFPVSNRTLRGMGLAPRLATDEALHEELAIARTHAHRADRAALPALVRWR